MAERATRPEDPSNIAEDLERPAEIVDRYWTERMLERTIDKRELQVIVRSIAPSSMWGTSRGWA